MKLDILRKIIREEVRGAIQEELKDLLLEAIRSPKQQVMETRNYIPPVLGTELHSSTVPISREQIRESYRNVLGETAASFNTSQVGKPLQMNGSTDTASPNGKLPDGEVSMNMIMGLMSGKK